MVNLTLSDVRTSVVPSDLIRMYLSSSNGRKVSFGSALMTGVALLAIEVSNCLRMISDEPVRSTDSTLFLGKTLKIASFVALLPDPVLSWILVCKTLKLDGVSSDVGRTPLLTPETVSTASITRLLVFTVVTRA